LDDPGDLSRRETDTIKFLLSNRPNFCYSTTVEAALAAGWHNRRLRMTESTWTQPIVEELSVPAGTFGGNPDADDAGADDGTVS